MHDQRTSDRTERQAHSSTSSTATTRSAVAAMFLAYRRNSRLSASEETAQMEICLRALTDLDPSKLDAVIIDLIQTSKFLPTVAEIRDRYSQMFRPAPDHQAEDFLAKDKIEQIVMTSPQGQRALGMEAGNDLVVCAIKDLGKRPTTKRLHAWLSCISDRWFHHKAKAQAESRAKLTELQKEPNVSMNAMCITLYETMQQHETELAQKYGNSNA